MDRWPAVTAAVKGNALTDEILDESFPGGAKFAHHLSERWARKDKLKEKDKGEKLKKEQEKTEGTATINTSFTN